ncbi:cytochrome P450 2E1 [Trichonephila inaurata madagascariensis]|uniref:Cytochrome P450 2E1 n=1 Tax=Trichonephila inaurata madagascariensis TaxID=2747483 RepID=A0A8X7C061_9ARAC|nr:cytochrome P450 2E1 [Trichonephila inaurata madagascariensis]
MDIVDFLHHPVVLCVLTTIWTLLVWFMAHRSQMFKLPPGPSGLPFLGYYPFLSSEPEKDYTRMGKIYGDIFSFRSLGGNLIVVVNSAKLIKEVLVKRADEFQGRPQSYSLDSWFTGGLGFTQEGGKVWDEQRQFFLKAISQMGFGTPELENQIQDEILQMLEEIRLSKEQSTDVHFHMNLILSKIMSYILFNEKFDKNMFLEMLLVSMNKIIPIFKSKNSILVGSMLRIKALLSPAMRTAHELKDFGRRGIDSLINEKVKSLESSSSKCYVDAYLQHRKELQSNGKDTESSFTVERLQANSMDLFFKGIESVSSTMSNMLIELSKHQVVQETLQEEMDSVVGRDRLLSWSDKQNLPKLDAAIQELYRITSQFLTTRFYSNFKATMIDGYWIPKRSIICANLGAVHFNPEIYPDPEKFQFERFLNKEGKPMKREGPYPFGIGKRSCVGEFLAQVEVFIIIGSLLQNFRILPGDSKGTLRFLRR